MTQRLREKLIEKKILYVIIRVEGGGDVNETLKTAIGILIPFLGTALGSCLVFFLKGEVKPGLQKLLLGFASGVMIAASVWSLIMPAIEMAEEQGVPGWLPAAAGFMGLAGASGRSSPRGSALEAGLCLAGALPVAFCCFWLVVSYRQDAATGVVWSYAPEIVALAASLLAFYYVAGHAYGRPRPFAAIFFCEFGAFSCFVTLPDSRLIALQVMFFALAVMQLYIGLQLTANLRPAEEIGERFPGALEAEGLAEPAEPESDEPMLEDMGENAGDEDDFIEVTDEFLGDGPEQNK